MHHLLKFALPILLIASQETQAAVYQWTDANGQTHFGDRPPSQAHTREVAVDAAPSGIDTEAQARHERVKAFVQEQQQTRSERQAQETEARKVADQQAQACVKLRARLKNMARISTFYRLDDNGNRVFVTEAENEQLRQNFRQKVAESCG
ncbi:MAG TPA: DUF4124 domain-containing protein [Marinobacter sp.]|nr:DUF4124 domain-containing protein [Marinobacter sp.]